MTEKGWELSPAYDINPSTDKNGLSLNIDMDDNALSFELAKSVGEFFRLNEKEMNEIIEEIITVVKNWKNIAKKIGISNKEQSIMESAFKLIIEETESAFDIQVQSNDFIIFNQHKIMRIIQTIKH